MITTVTLNPCIDYSVAVPNIALGQLNMMDSSRVDIAGKGVNVAVVLARLGIPACCTGISFDENHAKLVSHLDAFGLTHDFVVAQGSIRTNLKIYDSISGEMTEINSRGERVSAEVLGLVREKIVSLAAKSEMVIMSGRIPNGADESIYRELMRSLRGLPCKIVIDAERQPLVEALKERPFLIKPNLYELAHSFGKPARSIPEILSVCGHIISGGVEIVCVSMGERGALIANREEAFYAQPPDVKPRGLQGAGDSMVAGICKAAAEGHDLSDMLRYGVAAASASIIREGTKLCREADFEEMLTKINIERVGL